MTNGTNREDAIPLNNEFSPRRIHPFLSNKFRRRNPMEYFYLPIECPLSRHCNNGFCPLSHTKLEMIFHPMVHKSKRCKMVSLSSCEFNTRCAFYHDSTDRVAAYIDWLDWKRTWEIWGENIERVLTRHKVDASLTRKVTTMVHARDNPSYGLGKPVMPIYPLSCLQGGVESFFLPWVSESGLREPLRSMQRLGGIFGWNDSRLPF